MSSNTIHEQSTNDIIFRNFPVILSSFIQSITRSFPRSRFQQDLDNDPNEYHWWITISDDTSNIERKIYGCMSHWEKIADDGTTTRELRIHTEFRHFSIGLNTSRELVYYDEMWYNQVTYSRILEVIREYYNFLHAANMQTLTTEFQQITV
jgi:hypothetical protein